MYASQPEIYDIPSPKNSLKRTATGTIFRPQHYGISSEDRDRKISQLKEYIINKGLEINEDSPDKTKDEFIAEQVVINSDDNPESKSTGEMSTGEMSTEKMSNHEIDLFYFIGRLNPPHNGHIKALKELVMKANQKGTKPLILLGSGPKTRDGERRTMDNPITFDLKADFIRNILERELPPLPSDIVLTNLPSETDTHSNSRYIIKEMTNPARDVPMFIQEYLDTISTIPLNKINIKHIAGGKDEDTTKLQFALNAAENAAKKIREDTSVSAEVEAVEPEINEGDVAMSATKVRKDAYKTLLPEQPFGFEGWPQIYKNFYGEYALPIYEAILFPLKDMSREEQIAVIRNYNETGNLPKPKETSAKKKKLGGTKRRKNKNNKKNKKTAKRKSRYIRRKR